MVKSKVFSTKILGDLDLDGMVILVCYNEQVIAEINYENGIDQMQIELICSTEESPKQFFPLEGFLEILQEAKEIAIQCAKEDEKFK